MDALSESNESAVWDHSRAIYHELVTKERLVFIIDMCDEMFSEWTPGKSRMTAVCDCRKYNTPSYCECGIATFKSSSTINWLGDVVCDIDNLSIILDGVDKEGSAESSEEEEVDVSRLLRDAIVQSADRCIHPDNSKRQRAIISRYIIFYSRSDQIPLVSDLSFLQDFPDSVVDIIYVHNKITTELESSRCRDAYTTLSLLTSAPRSRLVPMEHRDISEPPIAVQGYMFDTHPSSIKLACIGAALLTHPLSRLSQQEFLKRMTVDLEVLETLRSTLTVQPSPESGECGAEGSKSGGIFRDNAQKKVAASSGEHDSNGEDNKTYKRQFQSKNSSSNDVEASPDVGKSGTVTSSPSLISSFSRLGENSGSSGSNSMARMRNFFTANGTK